MVTEVLEYNPDLRVEYPSHGQVTLTTPRLILGGASPEDAEPLFKSCFSDPETMWYWDDLPHQEVATSAKWVRSMINSASNGVTDFIIGLKSENGGLRVIGKAGVWKGEELGFMLAREFWGQGLMKEALDVLLDYCFHERSNNTTARPGGHDGESKGQRKRHADLPLARMVVDVDPRNAACLGLLTKFGFEKTGYKANSMQVGGHWVDSVYLELTREKFLQGRSSDKVVKGDST